MHSFAVFVHNHQMMIIIYIEGGAYKKAQPSEEEWKKKAIYLVDGGIY